MWVVNNQKNQSGFTLLEVLITLVILAIGLLGLAGLQATGLKNNHSAYMRSQATQLAYDMADRMRANKIAVNNYLTASPTEHTSCLLNGCNPSEMAEHDLFEWTTMLTSTLPLGESTISSASQIYTIRINWDDNRDGIVDGDDPDFRVSFEL